MIINALKRAFQPRNAILETLGANLTDPRLWEGVGGQSSSSGENVTHDTALMIPAVWQGVSTISGDTASLPLHFYERLDTSDQSLSGGSRRIATGENAKKIETLVSTQPNEFMSAYEYWRTMMVYAILWGNAYGHIKFRPGESVPNRATPGTFRGRIDSLELFHPDEITPAIIQDGNKQTFVYHKADRKGDGHFLHPGEVLHIKGPANDFAGTTIGMDLLRYAKEAYGLALAGQKFNSKFFAKGMQLSGILMIPPTYTQEAKDNLIEGWEKRLTGSDNAFSVAVLRDGATFQQTSADPEKGQLRELREDQVREVARTLNIPAAKLNLEDSVSYNSTEQLQLIYLTTTLRHWLTAITSECNLKLRTQPQKDRGSHFFEHDISKLIATDAKTREEILQIRRQNMIITANNWRDEIGEPRLDDPEADKLFNPNTRDTSETDNATSQETSDTIETEETEEQENNSKVRPLIRDTVNRVFRKITAKLQKLARKPNKYLDWCDRDNKEDIETIYAELYTPLCAMGLDDVTETIADKMHHDLWAQAETFLNPPHSANDLHKNVTNHFDLENSTWVDDWTDKILTGEF